MIKTVSSTYAPRPLGVDDQICRTIIVAGNATCQSLCPSVRRSVCPTLLFSHFELLTGKKVQIRVFQVRLIAAPAQPPATGVAVYTAWFTQRNL